MPIANERGAVAPPRKYTQLRLLTDNDEALQAKRHLIANAQRSLDLAYFILEIDGSTSRLLLDLVDAAKRGVKVRLLLDYFLTFEQAPELRALAGVENIEVRRFGLPASHWLVALDEAGIDRDAFIKALMAADVSKMMQALKGNTILAPGATDAVGALKPETGESAVGFPIQMVAALTTAQASPAVAGAEVDRQSALRKVALLIQIVRGLKQYMHRTHHKLLLADASRFIMGGRNLADAYQCTAPQQGRAFLDTDIVALDAHPGGSKHQASFQGLWDNPLSVDIAEADPMDNRPPMALEALEQRAAPAGVSRRGLAFERGAAMPDLDGYLVDNMPGDKGDKAITLKYVELVQALIDRGQRAVVDIVTAYLFLVDDAADSPALLAMRNVFLAAAQAGISVNIYTNSLASTDLKPVNWAAYPKLATLLQAGVNIFELDDGQGSLHTKCAAIGNDCLVVGSYNMDPRSELYDTNNLIVLHDPSGAATAVFRQKRITDLKWTRLTAGMVSQWANQVKASPADRLTQSLL